MILALDFDGTLVDSMPALEDLAVQVIQDAFPEYPEATIRRLYKASAGDPFERQLPWILPLSSGYNAGHWDQIAERFAARKGPVTRGSPVFTEVADFLSACDQAQHPLYVISSTRRDLIRWCLDQHGLLSYFIDVYGIEAGSKLKQLEKLQPHWFIGDSARDRGYAKQAEVQFAGVSRNPKLLPPGPDTSPDLLVLLERLP